MEAYGPQPSLSISPMSFFFTHGTRDTGILALPLLSYLLTVVQGLNQKLRTMLSLPKESKWPIPTILALSKIEFLPKRALINRPHEKI